MRWEKKYNRCVRRFTLFPIVVNDEYRWLEIVYIIQRLKWLDWCWCWVNDKFVDKECWKEWNRRKENG